MATINEKRTLILAHGTPPPASQLRRLAAEHDVLIATDGAAQTAAALGVMPDIISGDFDSLSLVAARRDFPQAEIIPTPDQNLGDLEKAILLACEQGATAITLTGATGGRLDHTLANIALLLRYHRDVPIHLVEEHTETRVISGTNACPGEWVLTATPGDGVSVISWDGLACVTLRGVQWPLENHPLPIGTLGVSNRATAAQVVVRVSGGALVVCHGGG